MKRLSVLLLGLALLGTSACAKQGIALAIPKTDVQLGISKTEPSEGDAGISVSLTATCTGVLSAFGQEKYCIGVRWLTDTFFKS